MKALSDSGRIPATSSGIGLHAGEAISGNIGSQARQQYSISGNVVILASRIEPLNKTAVRSSSSRPKCCARLARTITALNLGLVQVKSRDEPIEIYRLA